MAGSLEAEWNEKLRAVEQAQRDDEEQRAADESVLTEQARERIANLAEDFPAVWRDERTPAKERKRMLALLIDDVTLKRKERIRAQVRFRGGATRSLEMDIPLNAWQKRSTNPKVVRLIDELLDEHTDAEAAEIPRGKNLVTGAENPFAGINVAWIRKRYGLRSFKERLLGRGMIPMGELCRRFGICRDTARDWQRRGLLRGRLCNEKGEWMFEIPSPESLPATRNGLGGKGQVAAYTIGGAV